MFWNGFLDVLLFKAYIDTDLIFILVAYNWIVKNIIYNN